MEYPTNKEAGARKPTDKETPQKDTADVVIEKVFDQSPPEPVTTQEE